MIDIHTHLHPPRLFAAIRRWFAERSSWVLPHPTEPQAVVDVMRAHGVEQFAFCSYAHKPGIARELNAWLVDTARTLGRGAVPLATVHVGDADPAGDAREALRAGCAGLKVHEDVQNFRLDDERLSAVLAVVAEREGFVLAHVGRIPWSDDTADGPARVARVLARHPALRIVVAHFGVPDHARYLALAAESPRLWLDTTMVFAPESPMHVAVPATVVEASATHILYGTDWPNVPHAYDAELRGLRALGLSDVALRAITAGNARQLSAAFR